MVLGIGIDLVEVERIRSAWERHGDRFVERVLVSAELAYCRQHPDPAPMVAVRFAAKEAVSKAFGTGIGEQIGWQDIEVIHHETGQPAIQLHGAGARLLAARGARTIHLSLTHTAACASAVAVIEG